MKEALVSFVGEVGAWLTVGESGGVVSDPDEPSTPEGKFTFADPQQIISPPPEVIPQEVELSVVIDVQVLPVGTLV